MDSQCIADGRNFHMQVNFAVIYRNIMLVPLATTIQFKNNSLLIFPSYCIHKVSHVKAVIS